MLKCAFCLFWCVQKSSSAVFPTAVIAPPRSWPKFQGFSVGAAHQNLQLSGRWSEKGTDGLSFSVIVLSSPLALWQIMAHMRPGKNDFFFCCWVDHKHRKAFHSKQAFFGISTGEITDFKAALFFLTACFCSMLSSPKSSHCTQACVQPSCEDSDLNASFTVSNCKWNQYFTIFDLDSIIFQVPENQFCQSAS